MDPTPAPVVTMQPCLGGCGWWGKPTPAGTFRCEFCKRADARAAAQAPDKTP